jgi:MOSC domain-containing protein YiiM
MSKLIAIATRTRSRAPMALHESAEVSLARGVGSDLRGRPGPRQVTLLSLQAWRAACAELGVDLDWTLRRANLLVDAIDWQDSVGARLRIGDALLEVTEETKPCRVMDKQHRGLRAALAPEWRGGVTCRVIEAGTIRHGDSVELARA